MKETILPKKINLLGNIITVASYIFLCLGVIGSLLSIINFLKSDFINMPTEIPGMQQAGIIGAIIGTLFACFILIFIPLKYSQLHSKLKKYTNNDIPKIKFISNYILCWLFTVFALFISLFSKNIAVIVVFILVFMLPIIYLIMIHKYTKNNGDSEI